MRISFFFIFLACSSLLFSQEKGNKNFDINNKHNSSDSIKKQKIAPIDLYKVITIENDTTYIDTSLTIQKEYSHTICEKTFLDFYLLRMMGKPTIRCNIV